MREEYAYYHYHEYAEWPVPCSIEDAELTLVVCTAIGHNGQELGLAIHLTGVHEDLEDSMRREARRALKEAGGMV